MRVRSHGLLGTLFALVALCGCNAFDDPSAGDEGFFGGSGPFPTMPFGGPSAPIPQGIAGSGFGQPVTPPTAGSSGFGPSVNPPIAGSPSGPITTPNPNDLDAGDDDSGATR